MKRWRRKVGAGWKDLMNRCERVEDGLWGQSMSWWGGCSGQNPKCSCCFSPFIYTLSPHVFFSLFFSVSSLQEMRVQGIAAKQVFKKAEWSHWKCFTVNSLILKVAGTRVVYIALFINNIFEVQQQNWIFVEKNIVLREESCRAFVKVFPYVAQSYKEVVHLSCFLF